MTSTTTTAGCSGPTKEQVEEVVRAVFEESRTNINDMHRTKDPEWVDQLVEFVQRRLSLKNDVSPATSQPQSPTDSTCASSTVSTPGSEFSDSPDFISAKPFQATVEDVPEECPTRNDEDSNPDGGDDDDGKSVVLSGHDVVVKPTANSCRRRPTQAPSGTQPRLQKAQVINHSTAPETSPRVESAPQSTASLHKPTATAPTSRDSYPTPPASRAPSPRLRPTVHFSDRPMPKLHHRDPQLPGPNPTTPTTPTTLATTVPSQGLSDIDLQWGRLFTGSGEPTIRLRQILHGLANYINDEFEPRGSTLITPDKLYSFYRRFRLEKEHYPFQRIFDTYSRKSLHSLKCLYQDLRCNYYLLSSGNGSRDCGQLPPIPGLTTDGFADWVANFMQATPDIEARRLARVVANLPIEVLPAGSASSSRRHTPERLPQQLSRHLFPSRPHDRLRQRVSNSVMEWDQAMRGYAEPSSSPSRPTGSSWTAAFYDAIARSLSPMSREYPESGSSGHRRRYNYPRSERAAYIEVPSSTGSKHNHSSARGRHAAGRSSRYSQGTAGRDDRDEGRRPSRDIITTYVEAEPAPRRRDDRSPRGRRDTHRRERDRSPPVRPQDTYRYVEPNTAAPLPPSATLPPVAAPACPPPPPYSQVAPPPPSSVAVSSPTLNRADNYALFQGRYDAGPGPTYEEFLREKDTAAHSRRPRYGG
ncbi:hydroxyproline-rich glycoprotein DZ-HRGP [Purpureocillium lavendulum]|uniref:Hydroxyproline-rich glycoprotein DZ-HRGP n=1 Tax=Purpureocillium lavendulum TaxID=1247861 RepID=A0AB34FNS1_9HYPO|nr:hydroxyproline-rich glycoprotein DZ-HRGP [Purpureocillium lavendulum]